MSQVEQAMVSEVLLLTQAYLHLVEVRELKAAIAQMVWVLGLAISNTLPMKLIVGLEIPEKNTEKLDTMSGFFCDDLASQMEAPEWKKWYQGLYTSYTQ